MKYQEFCDSVLPHLKTKFVLYLDEKSSNDDKIILRTTISSGTEAENFMKDFSDITSTKWIVLRKKTHFTR